MKIQRSTKNPIVIPGSHPWRKVASFNPAVIIENGTFYMLERACSGLQPLKCQLGLLESTNGIDFKLVEELPVFGPEQLGYPQGTVEDPRVVKIDDTYYLTFAHRHYNYNCVPNGITEPNYSPVVGKMFEGINNTRSGIATSKRPQNLEIRTLDYGKRCRQ